VALEPRLVVYLLGNRYYLRVFGSMDEVGYYKLAARFASLLGLVIWQPFSQFWEMERFRHYQKPDAPAVFSSVFEFASLVLFVGALCISIFADPVIQLMSAPAFHRASALVPWLAFGWLFGFLTLFANFSFLITEETVLISRNNYITVAVITVLNFVLIPRFGLYWRRRRATARPVHTISARPPCRPAAL